MAEARKAESMERIAERLAKIKKTLSKYGVRFFVPSIPIDFLPSIPHAPYGSPLHPSSPPCGHKLNNR
jgi:hypothetical protein